MSSFVMIILGSSKLGGAVVIGSYGMKISLSDYGFGGTNIIG